MDRVDELLEVSNKTEKQLLSEIINDLETLCFCTECYEVMDCYSHFCEKCKQRVSVPLDAGFFAEYLKKKYKVGVKGK